MSEVRITHRGDQLILSSDSWGKRGRAVVKGDMLFARLDALFTELPVEVVRGWRVVTIPMEEYKYLMRNEPCDTNTVWTRYMCKLKAQRNREQHEREVQARLEAYKAGKDPFKENEDE